VKGRIAMRLILVGKAEVGRDFQGDSDDGVWGEA
jgi:hypothetical protein